MVFVVIHTLRPTLKGLDHSHFACLCLLASMLYACVNLSCSRLCHVWHPRRVCGCVVTFDAHEALFGCNHLGMHLRMLGCFMHAFPFFHSVRWYACHACLCHPLAWVLLASVSSMLQHNEVMNIWFKPKFVPREHQLLFVFLLVCFFACLLAFLLYSPCLSCSSILWLFIYSLHVFLRLLVCWFLFFAFALHTWSEDA